MVSEMYEIIWEIFMWVLTIMAVIGLVAIIYGVIREAQLKSEANTAVAGYLAQLQIEREEEQLG